MKYLFTFIFFAFNLFSFEEVVKKEFPLKDIEKIWVENVNGDIEIFGEDIDVIILEAVKKAEKEQYLKNLKIVISTIPNVSKSKTGGKILHIETEHTRSYLFGFLPVKMGGSVKYKLKLPKGMDLKLETVNGSIIIEEVNSYIEAESVNGSLNLKNIFGNGNFATVNGDIEIQILNEFPNLNAESVNGNIIIKSLKKINARYSIEVVNGKIKIIPEIMEIKSSAPKEISGKWGDGKGKVNFKTVNGSVTIEMEEGKY